MGFRGGFGGVEGKGELRLCERAGGLCSGVFLESCLQGVTDVQSKASKLWSIF